MHTVRSIAEVWTHIESLAEVSRMGVSAQAMRAIAIPAETLAAQPHEPMPGASADAGDSARTLLIETIRKNVMAWTRWNGVAPVMRFDRTEGVH